MTPMAELRNRYLRYVFVSTPAAEKYLPWKKLGAELHGGCRKDDCNGIKAEGRDRNVRSFFFFLSNCILSLIIVVISILAIPSQILASIPFFVFFTPLFSCISALALRRHSHFAPILSPSYLHRCHHWAYMHESHLTCSRCI